MVSRVLCTPRVGLNPDKPVRLIDHFVKEEKKQTTTAALFEPVRHAFGWPIGISYAIRNHFVHDGAQFDGCDFFEGAAASAAFRIPVDGWKRVEKQAESYGIDQSCHRAGASWPSVPTDDLRVVLNFCEREMDDALGVLLGSACSLLLAHAGFMVGED